MRNLTFWTALHSRAQVCRPLHTGRCECNSCEFAALGHFLIALMRARFFPHFYLFQTNSRNLHQSKLQLKIKSQHSLVAFCIMLETLSLTWHSSSFSQIHYLNDPLLARVKASYAIEKNHFHVVVIVAQCFLYWDCIRWSTQEGCSRRNVNSNRTLANFSRKIPIEW